jgi:hypothetical protein
MELKSGVIKRFKLKKQLLTELVLEDFLFKQENLFLLYLSDYCLNKMIQLLEVNSYLVNLSWITLEANVV